MIRLHLSNYRCSYFCGDYTPRLFNDVHTYGKFDYTFANSMAQCQNENNVHPRFVGAEFFQSPPYSATCTDGGTGVLTIQHPT